MLLKDIVGLLPMIEKVSFELVHLQIKTLSNTVQEIFPLQVRLMKLIVVSVIFHAKSALRKAGARCTTIHGNSTGESNYRCKKLPKSVAFCSRSNRPVWYTTASVQERREKKLTTEEKYTNLTTAVARGPETEWNIKQRVAANYY